MPALSIHVTIGEGPPDRLDRALAAHAPPEASLSRSRLARLIAAGAVAWWRRESKVLALALTLLLLVKLGWEQSQGALPLSGDMTVIVAAHLYGAIGGTLAGVLILFGPQRWPWSAR